MIKYLITGTGRCGTVYMSRLLTSMGFMCGHESVFEHDGIDAAMNRLMGRVPYRISHCSTCDLLTNTPIENWFVPSQMIAESSFLAAPYLNLPELASVKIIHIVRHPLQVISSFVKDIHFFTDKPDMLHWQKLIREFCPKVMSENTEIERACRYYVEWNKLISKKDLFLKIEEQPNKDLKEFLNFNSNLSFNNTKINSWKRRTNDLNFSHIPKGSLKDEFMFLCELYGYI